MKRLKELRVARGMSQRELAELAGITQRAISSYESGERRPTGETLLRIAQIFGVSPEYLMGWSDDPEPSNQGTDGAAAVSERVRLAISASGLSLVETAERAKLPYVTVKNIVEGRAIPSLDTIRSLAMALGVSTDYLLGLTALRGPAKKEGGASASSQPDELRMPAHSLSEATPWRRVSLRMLPVLGAVAAGHPLLAEENIIDYLAVPDELADQADFVLRVTGDSMVGAGIYDGDYVLMKKVDGSEIKSGDIVAALVNGESTLKFLQYRDGKWYLEPANPNYPPIPIDDDVEVQVQAKFVALYTKRIRLNRPRGDAAQALDNVSDEDLIQALAERRGLDPEVVKAILMALRKGK